MSGEGTQMTNTMTTTPTMTPKALKSFVLEALTAAKNAPFTPGRASGCGRAYVIVSADRKTVNTVAATCKTLGLMFLRKAYGTSGNAIYIGYDNGRGDMLAKSEAFAAVLNGRGLRCYTDAVSD